MKNLGLIVLALTLTGCAAKTATHPGATAIDSYTYDVLLVEQDAINAARSAFVAGTLPATAHDPLNVAIQQYNVTETAWQAFHAAGGAGDATALNAALNALVGAVGALQQALGKAAPTVPLAPVTLLWRPHGYAYS